MQGACPGSLPSLGVPGPLHRVPWECEAGRWPVPFVAHSLNTGQSTTSGHAPPISPHTTPPHTHTFLGSHAQKLGCFCSCPAGSRAQPLPFLVPGFCLQAAQPQHPAESHQGVGFALSLKSAFRMAQGARCPYPTVPFRAT